MVRSAILSKTHRSTGCLLLLLLVLFSACRSTTSPTLTIGALLPLTGDAAVYGVAIKNGIELAVERLNANGGVAGKPLRVIYEDDRGQASAGVSGMRKLIDVDKVHVVIGGAMSSVCAAIAPLAQTSRVVLISPTASAPALSNAGPYFFRIWPSDLADGEFMAVAARDRLDLRRVSILYVNTEYGTGIEQVFRREFEKRQGIIVSSEGYPLGATDFRAQLTKIRSLRPDALYLPGYYQEVAGILRQMRELGVRTKILGVNSFHDPRLLAIARDTAEGAIFTYPTYESDSPDPKVAAFVEAYRQRYGQTPDPFAAQGYDALQLLAAAWSKGATTAEDIRRVLSETKDFPGVAGPITFVGSDVMKPLRLMTVQQGRFVAVGDSRRP